MKKLYTLVLFLNLAFIASAQVPVTLEVDMNNVPEIGMGGVHVAGNFGDLTPGQPTWVQDGLQMMDGDDDGIYSITLDLLPGEYQFKYLNGNVWAAEEDVPGICEFPGTTNRSFVVGDEAASDLVCYSECAACGMYSVRFRVDMTQEAAVNPAGIHVAGSFQQPAAWTADATPMSDDDEDGVWEVLVSFSADALDEDGNIAYKYINGNDWLNPNESVADECGSGGNRVLSISEASTLDQANCYNLCSTCVEPSSITFRVDMSNAGTSGDGVYIAGAFQGWNDSSTQLADTGSDIYEITLDLQPGSYQYKFLNGPGGWENVPGDCATDGNRVLDVVNSEPMTVTFCYEQCVEACVNDPDPEDITFRVDMSEVAEINAEGVWLIGSMTDPAWQAGATQMTDDDMDGVYEATLNISGPSEFQYKFANGDPYPMMTNDESVNETGDFEALGCGVPNGLGAFNRVYTRDGSGVVLDEVCFGLCAACIVSIDELEAAIELNVYPNPTADVLNLVINDASTTEVIEIINGIGQVVVSIRVNQNGTFVDQLNVEELAAGMYTLRVRTENGDISKLIVKK